MKKYDQIAESENIVTLFSPHSYCSTDTMLSYHNQTPNKNAVHICFFYKVNKNRTVFNLDY